MRFSGHFHFIDLLLRRGFFEDGGVVVQWWLFEHRQRCGTTGDGTSSDGLFVAAAPVVEPW